MHPRRILGLSLSCVLLTGCHPSLHGEYRAHLPGLPLSGDKSVLLPPDVEKAAVSHLRTNQPVEFTLRFTRHKVRYGVGGYTEEGRYTFRGNRLITEFGSEGYVRVIPMTVEPDGTISARGLTFKRHTSAPPR